MSNWSLTELLSSLHDDIEQKLAIARKSFAHPVTKGDASEQIWLQMLQTYLPTRYQATSAHVVDSHGDFSEQIDIVIFDRQYTPFIFSYQGQTIIPSEGVYAVFEAKQTINADHVAYARNKIASVRRLYRTSLPIPHAGGVYPPKALPHILGGLVTFESDWSPGLGEALAQAMSGAPPEEKLDLGCVAAYGTFASDQAVFPQISKPATAFLFELIARLQASATVPMIDIRAYANWLASS